MNRILAPRIFISRGDDRSAWMIPLLAPLGRPQQWTPLHPLHFVAIVKVLPNARGGYPFPGGSSRGGPQPPLQVPAQFCVLHCRGPNGHRVRSGGEHSSRTLDIPNAATRNQALADASKALKEPESF